MKNIVNNCCWSFNVRYEQWEMIIIQYKILLIDYNNKLANGI